MVKKQFQQASDKNGKPIKQDDLCKVELPGSRLHGKVGKVVEIFPAQDGNDKGAAQLEFNKPARSIKVLLSNVARIKLAENTSEYRGALDTQRRENDRIHRNFGRGYGPKSLDIHGADQANYAVADAIRIALEKH